MEKGTIIYVGGFEMPDKNAAAHRVLNNGKILRNLNYQVVFLGISHSANKITKTDFDGFECWAVPYPKSLFAWIKYLTDASELEHVAEKYTDIAGVIFYNYQAIALFNGIRFCRKKNIFCMADTTEWYLATSPNVLFNVIKQVDTSLRMRYIQPKMDGIIAISSYLNDFYKKKGCHTIQIPPLIDKNENKWKVEVHSRENRRIQLIYAGSPGDIKDNLTMIVSVVSQHSESMELHVIGNINKKDIDKKGGNIFYYGKVPHSKCVEMISKSDFQVFLRPDNLVTRAGFPTKLGESFACGTPVITTIHSNVCDYLEEGKNAFIVSEITQKSLESVFQKITDLGFEKIESMKKYCRKDTRFDYHSYVEQLQIFIDNLE